MCIVYLETLCATGIHKRKVSESQKHKCIRLHMVVFRKSAIGLLTICSMFQLPCTMYIASVYLKSLSSLFFSFSSRVAEGVPREFLARNTGVCLRADTSSFVYHEFMGE